MVKDKSQLSAWTTSVAECAEGFVTERKNVAECATRGKDLQLRLQIRTVDFCNLLNIKHSYVDVVPTLGVNHVYLVL